METKNTTLPLITFVEYIKKRKIVLNKFSKGRIKSKSHTDEKFYWILKNLHIVHNIVIDNFGNIIKDEETVKEIYDFYNDKIKIEGLILEKIKKEFSEHIEKGFNKKEIVFSEFSTELKERIKNMQITYTVAYFPTLKEVEEYRTISK